jgi:predicted O-linked N-acetylglucosamine transferase (SPINDLY family)
VPDYAVNERRLDAGKPGTTDAGKTKREEHSTGKGVTPMATISEALAIAVQHHQAGRLQTAEQICRQILALRPDHAETWHLLGVIDAQTGNRERAAQCISRAVALKPDCAEAHDNLGTLAREQGNLDEAIACYRRALELKPDFAGAQNNLGCALSERGNLEEAMLCYRRALMLNPDFVLAHNNLGLALNGQRKLDEAAACYRRALELQPDFVPARKNLGDALREQGRCAEAEACYRRVLTMKPDDVEARNNLGVALLDQGKFDDAAACFRRVLELSPNSAETNYNLGNALKDGGDLDEAIACYRRALELRPNFAAAHNNLGNALKDGGSLDDAIACFRRAVDLKPDFAQAGSNLVLSLCYCPGSSAQAVYEELRDWNRRFAEPLTSAIQPHANDRAAGRLVRVGYLSPNLCSEPVGRFLLPLLERHDHRQFEIFCYASQSVYDKVTDRCRACADAWRNVLGLSDEQLAHAIRQDRIDILVDPTMHTGNNRLLVFARTPAPVQVSYLAYCGTTGLRTMDYRLTDPYLDPPGQTERFYSEQSVWLPETYWCYQPLDQSSPVSRLPALQAGHVTFGCLNNFCKVTAPTLAAWSRLLGAVPGSQLLLHAHAGSHRRRVLEFFARQRVSAERVRFVPMLPMADYFRLYERIDVALDPFPYGGGTTTCDALWMGVPVVSLAGNTAVGRGALSILSNAGLPELVARNPEQYVQIAAGLAGDMPRLSGLRATLRQRMQKSPLMDAPRFARNVEAAYRTMWRRWCERGVSESKSATD